VAPEIDLLTSGRQLGAGTIGHDDRQPIGHGVAALDGQDFVLVLDDGSYDLDAFHWSKDSSNWFEGEQKPIRFVITKLTAKTFHHENQQISIRAAFWLASIRLFCAI
jgi:hypothetical protein